MRAPERIQGSSCPLPPNIFVLCTEESCPASGGQGRSPHTSFHTELELAYESHPTAVCSQNSEFVRSATAARQQSFSRLCASTVAFVRTMYKRIRDNFLRTGPSVR